MSSTCLGTLPDNTISNACATDNLTNNSTLSSIVGDCCGPTKPVTSIVTPCGYAYCNITAPNEQRAWTQCMSDKLSPNGVQYVNELNFGCVNSTSSDTSSTSVVHGPTSSTSTTQPSSTVPAKTTGTDSAPSPSKTSSKAPVGHTISISSGILCLLAFALVL